jgi:hypothetical protein
MARLYYTWPLYKDRIYAKGKAYSTDKSDNRKPIFHVPPWDGRIVGTRF